MTDNNKLAINQALGVERLGEIMFKSGYWADTRSQSQAIVKILAGAEHEFGPIASMNGIYIIDGRTTLSATLVGAAIQRSGRYRYRVVEHDDTHCTIEFFEIISSGRRERVGVSEFTMQDAETAGLLAKRGGNWQKFPRNMLFSRALTNGARWYTPDVFGGPVYTPDEMGAEVDESGAAIDVPFTPTRDREVQDAAPDPRRIITSADDRIWQRWEDVRAEALKWGVRDVPALTLPLEYARLVDSATALITRTQAKQAQLAKEDAERAAGAQAAQAEVASAPDPWAINRELMVEAHRAGLVLRDLPTSTPLVDVEIRNDEIRQALGPRQP